MGSIRALKLHAWEVAFEERIAALRRKEVATLLHFQVLNAIAPSLSNRAAQQQQRGHAAAKAAQQRAQGQQPPRQP